jgi:hypothetical protein
MSTIEPESQRKNDRPLFRNQKSLEEEYSFNKLVSDNPLKSAVNYGMKYKPDRYWTKLYKKLFVYFFIYQISIFAIIFSFEFSIRSKIMLLTPKKNTEKKFRILGFLDIFL